MAKIHLIGASSYIGSLLQNYLKAAGHQVEKAEYRLPNIKAKSIEADIVVHLAAAGGGTEHNPRTGDNDPEFMRSVNVGGMMALMEGIKHPQTKILFLSSAAVYGKYDSSPIVNEEAILNPVSRYGEHKVESERILTESDFDWISLRPCGIFGPAGDGKFGNSFLNVVVANAFETGKINLFGGGQQIDTLYLNDLLNVILRICNGEWHSCQAFNVAGEVVEVSELIYAIADAILNLGFNCSVVKKDFNGKPAALADTTKLKKAFPGWKPTALHVSAYSLVTTYLSQFEN